MATYYEIEIVDSSEHETIKRLGELGFKVKGVVPPGQPGSARVESYVILQRARCLPERGKLRDNYYASIADNAPTRVVAGSISPAYED